MNKTCPKCGRNIEYTSNDILKIGAGMAAGSAAGAMLGSVIPGLGTAVGAVAGGVVGKLMGKGKNGIKCPYCNHEIVL